MHLFHLNSIEILYTYSRTCPTISFPNENVFVIIMIAGKLATIVNKAAVG